MPSQHPVQQCWTGDHTHHKMFLLKWEMSLYFTRKMYLAFPNPMFFFFLLFITTIIIFTITNHMGSWDHLQKRYHHSNEIHQYFHHLKLELVHAPCVHSITCWLAMITVRSQCLLFRLTCSAARNQGYWCVNGEFIHFITGQRKPDHTQVIPSLFTDQKN